MRQVLQGLLSNSLNCTNSITPTNKSLIHPKSALMHSRPQSRILLTVFFSFILLVSCQVEKAESTNPYEAFLTKVHQRGQFNGNALVLDHGEVVYKGSFGLSNIDPIDSLDLNSVFRLGSVSKQFTAMGIMKLKESGALDYDQDIRDFIPEIPYEGITIRNLLNHTSGLPDYYPLLMEHWKPELAIDDPERFISGNDDIINILAEHQPPVHFSPGEEWDYSNTGYVLLASIVSRASGMPFENYLKKEVFEPAGMNNTVVYDFKPGFDESMPNKAFGFRVDFNGKDRIYDDVHFMNPAQGDGGIYSTLDDLLKWDRILYKEDLISADTREEAFTPAVLANGDTTDYGFGWTIAYTPEGHKVVQHGGSWVGFRTFIFREIEDNSCIIILTNNATRYLGGVLFPMIEILHEQPHEIPKINISDAIGKIAVNEGPDGIVAEYEKLKKNEGDEYDFDEYHLNALGYDLMGMDKLQEAVVVLRLNKDEFPESANTYDSLGDALLAIGDSSEAMLNFNKAFEMDSAFTYSFDKAKEIEIALAN